MNPGQSVKDIVPRSSLSRMRSPEVCYDRVDVIVEGTAGNTGIGLDCHRELDGLSHGHCHP